MKISLLGFMGTGKTSVGKLLAEEMELSFLDTDELIVESSGLEIPDIFDTYGEEHFRQLEKKVLKDTVNKNKEFVLSTGGGIVLSEDNRKLLEQKTYPFLLKASPDEIYRRVKDDGGRPLLETDNPKKKIKNLLYKRREYYDFFQRTVDTEGKSPQDICREIIFRIKKEIGG